MDNTDRRYEKGTQTWRRRQARATSGRLACDCEAAPLRPDMIDVTPDHFPPENYKHECPNCGRWWLFDERTGEWEVDR
jgi:hypothetical protein